MFNIVESGNVSILKHFVYKFADLKPTQYIRAAIEHGHYEMIKYLLDLGWENLYIWDIWAALEKRYFKEVIELILNNGKIIDKEWKS